MRTARIIFPDHLFRDISYINKNEIAVLVEHPVYFSTLNYHKKKLLLHRASMKFYIDYLKKQNIATIYIQNSEFKNKKLSAILKNNDIGSAFMFTPADARTSADIDKEFEKSGIKLCINENPSFLTRHDEFEAFFEGKKHLSMTSFYISRRKKLDILLEEGKPVGGKWSLDPQNRKSLPKDMKIPDIWQPDDNKYVRQAARYVNENFPGNPGSTENFFYPVTFDDCDKWLDDFLANRLPHFGDYEDALSTERRFLFHSLLSPMLNNGMLGPRYVVDKALAAGQKHRIPLNNIEGFVRQIIGWREFMNGVYLLCGERQRNGNFWGHQRKIPASFYNATTGIPPLDNCIKHLTENAYLHHIERLMAIGSFMLLCEISPGDVYRWFMELFIDAYDWVMVPNVYAMSQYSDGGMITTKPYICSSNYIKKMSDYPDGDWAKIWDALYWRFIDKNKDTISQNPRLKIMVSMLKRQDRKRIEKMHKTAEKFLGSLK